MRSATWARRYPPLAAFVVVILLAVVVLPSALNVPQANPTTVLEYAPVPPEDDSPPPPSEGAISELGLGVSDSLTVAQAPLEQVLPQLPEGRGERPITKRCVGRPLRQTEDPNSPPCVPHWEGDNGGETWQGVTGDEIVVLVYHSSLISDQNETEGGDTSVGEWTPAGEYCDIDLPSEDQSGCQDSNTGRELSTVAALRALSRYFNDRFQTYGRHVHLHLYWTIADTPAARRAEAQEHWQRLRPFAVIDQAFFGGYNDAYVEAITRRNVMVFGSFTALANSFYRRHAPNFWTFWPDVERWAAMYSSYVCDKVAPYPNAIHAGPGLQGQPRRYALMYTTDERYPSLQLFRELVEAELERCGVQIVERAPFPTAGYAVDNTTGPGYAITNVARMQEAGVTTVLWLGGMEIKTTTQADRVNWYPEWIVAGDRTIDSMLNGRWQNQNAWRHAWVVSHLLREDRFADSPARQAFREAEPRGRQIHEYWATLYYRDLFTLLKAIQVAGPELAPHTVDRGLHAIPRAASPNPFVAACFYDPGDYTCVKDAHEAWWDPGAPDPNGESGTGCYRLVREGRRFLAGEWEGGDADVFSNPSDPCNGYKGSVQNSAIPL